MDPETEVLEVFLGTAINMEGLGDGTFEVHAISHDALLASGWTSLDSIVTVPEGGCVSLSAEPVTLVGETCEIPSCDGGTLLTAGGRQTPKHALQKTARLCPLATTATQWRGSTSF